MQWTAKHSAPRTVICGHRGGGGDPENREILTQGVDWSALGHEPGHFDYRDHWANRLDTFRHMLEQGVRSFELDLLPSRDGDVMMVHNSEINGRKVWETSTEELEEQGCPSIETLLDMVETFRHRTGERVELLLEMKGALSSETATDAGENGVAEQSEGMVRHMVELLRERTGGEHGWDYGQLPLIGFNHGMLKLAKSLEPEVHIGLSYAREHFGLDDEQMVEATSRPDYAERIVRRMAGDAREAGACAIIPDDRLIDAQLIEKAHANGLKVWSWTDFSMRERPEEMIRMGVDTVISDRPLHAQEVLEQLQPKTAAGRLQQGTAPGAAQHR